MLSLHVHWSRPGVLFAVLAWIAASGCRLGVGIPQFVRARAAEDRSYPSQPKSQPILLTEGDVEEPYVVLGTAQSRSYRESEVDTLGAGELRDAARKMGGDAVIHVAKTPTLTEEFGYSPGALTRVGPKFVTQYVLGGVVVRLASPAETPAGAQSPDSQPAEAPRGKAISDTGAPHSASGR
ncbi:MAG: hypothetical protein NTW86_25915 [Candidatus Sumerlaeota bacterium]|nr:hypothetical protein [Candidatus Sumerlaeota bacterium]